MVQGLLILNTDESVDCTQVAAEIFTLRGGTDEKKWVKSGILAKNIELKSSQPTSLPFAFKIPGNPFDYSADAKMAQWTLKVSIDLDGAFADDVTDHFTVVPDKAKYRSEGNAPGAVNPDKPTVIVPEPSPYGPGDYLGAGFLGLFPLGFMIGGMFIAWNGANVPMGIRYFALAMVLGGMFVLTRIFEGFNTKAGMVVANLFATLSIGLAVMGAWVTWFAPQFAWGKPSESVQGGLLAGPMTDPALIGWVIFHVFTLFGLSVFQPDTRRKAAGFEMIILLVAGTVVARGLAFGAEAALGGLEIQPYHQTAWIWGGLSLIFVGMVIRRPGWANLSHTYILPAGALAIVPALLEWFHGGGSGLATTVFGSSLLLLGAFILYNGSKNWLAERHIGKVEVRLGRKSTTVGSTIPVQISFTPRKPVQIQRISLEMECTGSSGTFRNGTWETQSWREDVIHVEIMKGFNLPANKHWSHELGITIPIGTRKSESGSSRSYSWQARITVEVKGYPDWVWDSALELT